MTRPGTATAIPDRREGDRPRSPECRASHMTFASRNRSAVEDDRPPIHRHPVERSQVVGQPYAPEAFAARAELPTDSDDFPPSSISTTEDTIKIVEYEPSTIPAQR